jgi:hypothetical protein
MDISSTGGGAATTAALNANPSSGVAASIQVSTINSTESLQESQVNTLLSSLGLGTNASHNA